MKIAICGKMCSGKSTLAQTIVRIDDRYRVVSIGAKVKGIAKELFGMTEAEKDRSLLVSIGSKMRDIDPNVWVGHVIAKTEGMTHCVVDDMRYQNEYELLRENGFVFIQIHVSPHTQDQRIRKMYPTNFQAHLDHRDHHSEQNNFSWLLHEPVLHIDNAEDYVIVHQRIHSFLQKDENNL